MKAEYVVVYEAPKEAVWLRKFFIDLEIVPDIAQSMKLYYDNSRDVANSKELRNHKCSKYIERRYHQIKNIVARRDVEVKQIFTHNNVTNPFIKTLDVKLFEKCLERL